MKQSINVVLRECVWLLFFAGLSACVQAEDDTYEEDTILKEAGDFFGGGAEGLADVIEKIFENQGRPNAYINGQEASGAIVIGARYGDGTLVRKAGGRPRFTGLDLPLVLMPVVIYPRFLC